MAAWKMVKLSEVCEIQRGGSPRPIENFITDADNGINWIKIGDVTKGAKYITSTKEKIKPEGAQSSRTVQEGEFLLSNSMSFGRPYILRTSGCIHDGWLVLRYDKKLLTEDYLYHVLGSDFVYAQFVKFAVGAVVKNLNSEVVKQVSIPLPSLEEQRRIAAILDQVDALRAKRREALAQLDSLTQSIFIEMFGDPISNPKRWKTCRLDEVSKKITDGTHKTPIYKGSGVEFLSAKDLKNGRIKWGTEKFISEQEHLQLFQRCNPELGDVLLAKSGSLGAVAIIDREHQFSLFESLCLIKYDRAQIDGRFLIGLLRNSSMLSHLLEKNKGIAIKHLHLVDVRSLELPLPPLLLQEQFACRIGAVEKLESSGLEAIEQIGILFTSLQHRAFRGEL